MSSLLEPGKYIVAVSGGVDSVALLQMLLAGQDLELVVAHFDHGIRPDSAKDMEFVSKIADINGLPFITERVELGPAASEATARKYRYEFLQKVREEHAADAIVTAHHQDDLIETALLNVLRGTKRLGLVSLRSTDSVKRPLLDMSKQDILMYAQNNNLQWREDSTNKKLDYKRNKIRHTLKNSLTPSKRQKITAELNQIEQQNKLINQLTCEYLNYQTDHNLNKNQLNQLQLAEAYEIAAAWLRQQHVSFDTEAIKRLVIGARILRNRAQIDIQHNYFAELGKDEITLKRR